MLYEIPPGQSRFVAWAGSLFVPADGLCSECQCQQESRAQNEELQASVEVFADYLCSPGLCSTGSDGSITPAYRRGDSLTFNAGFSIPTLEREVVIAITSVPRAGCRAHHLRLRCPGRLLPRSPRDPRLGSLLTLGRFTPRVPIA